MKKFYFIFSFIYTLTLNSQTTIDFESSNIPVDSFLNGSDGAGGFDFETVFFPNTFQDFGTFVAWSGWSISAARDVTTAGFTNQHSCISGEGYDNSTTYAVSFVSGESQIKLTNNANGKIVDGCYINNATYPFLSMQNGDGFAKKFGGESGNDPDFFLLTVKKYHNGQLSQDSVNFYLADYRFDDNSQDYIVEDWTFLDLKSLGNVDSLSFTLSSSDVGVYGMNTPGYFCIDNFTTLQNATQTNEEEAQINFNIFPNPTSHNINFELENNSKAILYIYDMNGQIIMQKEVLNKINSINIYGLNTGQYRCIIKHNEKLYASTFIKM